MQYREIQTNNSQKRLSKQNTSKRVLTKDWIW